LYKFYFNVNIYKKERDYMKKIILGFILGCVLTFGITTNAAEISGQLARIYDSITGGKIDIFDSKQNLNVRLGSEAGTADNVGGTLILYNKSKDKARVGIGIDKEIDAGIINFLDTNDAIRASIKADDSVSGPIFFLTDSGGLIPTYLTLTEGYINNEKIVTSADMKNYYTKAEVEKLIKEALEK
jgi:hypothetical protein